MAVKKTQSTVKRTKGSKGCGTCKRRKKKCDETKPVCKNCTRLELECSYNLTLSWNAQNQLKGGSTCIYFNKHHNFINSTTSDVCISYELFRSSKQLKPITDSPKSTGKKREKEFKNHISDFELELLTNDPNIGPQISEQFLFKLYTDVLSRTKSFAGVSEFVHNDFISIVIPGCQKFPALYRSVLALSALDLIKTETSKPAELQDRFLCSVYETLFFKYKNDALNNLHDILDNFDVGSVSSLEELVITIILLCNIEITNKGNKNWTKYLSEASVVFCALSVESILGSEIFIFAYKYFSLRYILLITTLDFETFTKLSEQTPWPIISEFFISDNIDAMFGCSSKLLLIIYKTVQFNFSYQNKTIQLAEYVAKISKIWYQLDYMEQYQHILSEELGMSAKSYLYSTKIFIYTSLVRYKLEKYLDDNYKHLVPKLWALLHKLSTLEKSLFFPNWCFLMISTVELDEDERSSALMILDMLEVNWPFSSVVEIRHAILSVWKMYDLCSTGWDTEPFDYQCVLAKFNYLLALT